MDDGLQQIQDTHRTRTRPIPSSRVIRVERKSSNGQLHDRQPYTPHIGSHGIGSALYSLRRHVGRCSYEGVCNRVNRLRCHSKITKFDTASRVDEDVGGLDISMHDTMCFVEIDQSRKNRFGDLPQHVHANRTKVFRYSVERAGMPLVEDVVDGGCGTYPQSMYSIHSTISLASFWKAP